MDSNFVSSESGKNQKKTKIGHESKKIVNKIF